MRNKKIIFTAVLISVIVALISDVLTPDLVTLGLLYNVDVETLKKVAFLGLLGAFFLVFYLKTKKGGG